MGLRASGKSTVGRALAVRLSRVFIDLDDLTAAELDAPTAGAALAAQGEPRFREAEAAALARILTRPGQIIALGGGTPTAPAARSLIESARAAGSVVTVYLIAPVDLLKRRLAADSTLRPSLTGRGTIDEVEQLHSRRDPIYRSLADRTVDADASPDAIAAAISELIA